MLNLHELEKRWLKYKIKSFGWYILPFSILLMIILAYLYRNDLFIRQSILQNIDKNNTTSAAVVKIVTEKNTTNNAVEDYSKQKIQESVKTIEKNTSALIPVTVKLKPSMQFIEKMEIEDESIKEEKNIQPKKIKNIPVNNKPTHNTIQTTVNKETRQKKTPLSITIKREETQKDLQQVIQRFQHNKNPALSLFIAKKYYEFGDYAQSYNYALITNQLNKDIEESWIIFAKSLVKLHKKNDAIKTLEKYINYSHSSTAAILLDDIKTGKFK